MLDFFQDIGRQAERINTACRASGNIESAPKLSLSLAPIRLSPASLTPSVDTAIKSFDPIIQRKLMITFDQYVSSSAEQIRGQYYTALEQMPSMQDIGGMPDADFEDLVCQMFQRQHSRHIDRINEALLILLDRQRKTLETEPSSSSFNHVSPLFSSTCSLRLADITAYRLHPRIGLSTQSSPQQRRERSSLSNGRYNSNSSKSYFLSPLFSPFSFPLIIMIENLHGA
jgi:hypothetical protein